MKKIVMMVVLLGMVSMVAAQNDRKTSTLNEKLTQKALQEWKLDYFGMFIHFGVYSKLAGEWKGEKVPFYGEQIMNHARIPVAEYEAVAREFNPKDFDADEVVSLAKKAGMKYIVFTTKHHDGFCMFDTKTTDYNIVKYTPYGKDVVVQLAEACKRQGMKLGFYYSLPDWHYPKGLPRLLPDESTKCWEYVNQVYSPLEQVTPELEEYIVQQITELLTNYGEICTMWFDMGLITPKQSKRFRDVVKKLQPKCLINGRIMNNMGDYMTLPDNGNDGAYGDIYWDNPASLYGTWGYKSWIERPEVNKQIDRQLSRLTSTVKHGGVFLLNIGPDGNGKVIDYEKEVLSGIGSFLEAHPDTLNVLSDESMMQTKPVTIYEEKGEVILQKDNGVVHPAIDGTGYMSVVADSWMSWNVKVDNMAEYDVFVVYVPQQYAKEYLLKTGKECLRSVLPGVDDMMQTAYMGKIHLMKGDNEVVFDQANRCNPLDALDLEIKKIILRKR